MLSDVKIHPSKDSAFFYLFFIRLFYALKLLFRYEMFGLWDGAV